MSAMGITRRQVRSGCVCYPPETDIRRLGHDVRFVPIADIRLFNHLVGGGEQGRRHVRRSRLFKRVQLSSARDARDTSLVLNRGIKRLR